MYTFFGATLYMLPSRNIIQQFHNFTAFLSTSQRSSFMYLRHTVRSLSNEKYFSREESELRRKVTKFWNLLCSLYIVFYSVLWISWAIIGSAFICTVSSLTVKQLSSTCTCHWNVKQRILGGERQREMLFIKRSYVFLYQWCKNVLCERILI